MQAKFEEEYKRALEGYDDPSAYSLLTFLTDDFAFEIIYKSTWHMNTILLFVEKE